MARHLWHWNTFSPQLEQTPEKQELNQRFCSTKLKIKNVWVKPYPDLRPQSQNNADIGVFQWKPERYHKIQNILSLYCRQLLEEEIQVWVLIVRPLNYIFAPYAISLTYSLAQQLSEPHDYCRIYSMFSPLNQTKLIIIRYFL